MNNLNNLLQLLIEAQEDLIASKNAIGRPKDQLMARELLALVKINKKS